MADIVSRKKKRKNSGFVKEEVKKMKRRMNWHPDPRKNNCPLSVHKI